jgi:DNA repair protein RecN (Recombination protein N)
MLAHLSVRNLGVLEHATITPIRGFTVITGETGAGKTMLLDALRLLGGQKSKPSAVGPFGDEAVAEGLFDDGTEELGVTRIVPRDGRSRAYLNGALVAAGALGERLGSLIEIVGQHDQLSITRSQTVLRLVDGMLDESGGEARARYLEAWEKYRAALDDQRRLGGDRMGLERELDLVRYQADEIAAAGLESGDDRRMEAMASRLRHAEVMRESLTASLDDLEAVADRTGLVVSSLRRVAAIDEELELQVSRAEGLDAETHDLLGSVRGLVETLAEDPETLEHLEQRLAALNDLKRKYGKTLEEVLEFGSSAARRVVDLEDLIGRAATIDDLVRDSENRLIALGERLRDARSEAIGRIESEASEHLAALGLPSASLSFAIEPAAPGPSGADGVELRFTSDQRLAAGAVSDVASGGELSRLVLALRLATRSPGTETLVFDEVDAGVGGATALALGRKLADLATECQVLCVTHLPQVAAHAEAHYVVDRSGSGAIVRLVEGEDRLTELSRMLAGLPESERGRSAAAELLEGARS